MTAVLDVKGLTVQYKHHGQVVDAVRNVDLELAAGETLGIVGESGCGKSTIAMAAMGLLPKNESRVPSGKIIFDGKDILANDENAWQSLRGRRIAIIFQDPFSALNPVLTVGFQLKECIDEPEPARTARAKELLREVQLVDADRILHSYPHQISGGQRQRVMIAMAIARRPEILIADEPTTALDVTVQDEIVKLLKKLQLEFKMGMIFVTHNMGLVKNITDRVAVMFNGEIVETGETKKVLYQPQHAYTKGLLAAMPRLHKDSK